MEIAVPALALGGLYILANNYDKNKENFEIKANWIMYQLILFNIIQNSVKYNQFSGDIIILTDCLPI